MVRENGTRQVGSEGALGAGPAGALRGSHHVAARSSGSLTRGLLLSNEGYPSPSPGALREEVFAWCGRTERGRSEAKARLERALLGLSEGHITSRLGRPVLSHTRATPLKRGLPLQAPCARWFFAWCRRTERGRSEAKARLERALLGLSEGHLTSRLGRPVLSHTWLLLSPYATLL